MRFVQTARVSILIGCVAVMAACGRSCETAPNGATTAPTNVASSSGAAAGSGTAAPAQAAGGAAGGAAACALMTVEEVARVMGSASVRAEGQPEVGGATYCTYRDASGKPLVATSYMRSGATVFNAVAASMQPQSGLGDKAQWDASSATLQVLKGSTMHAITAGDGTMAIDRRLDLAKQLGAIGVARQ
jgi:hypothetical protein